MNHEPFKKERQLCTKLDEYHVKVPDIPMRTKNTRWERFINMLASPTRNPIEPLVSTTNGFILLRIAPIMGAATIALLQALLFL